MMFLHLLSFIGLLRYSACTPESLGIDWFDYYAIPETDYQAQSFNSLLFSIKYEIDSLEFVDPADKEMTYLHNYAPTLTTATHDLTKNVTFRPGYSQIERLWLSYRDEKAFEGFKTFLKSSGLELNFNPLDIDPHDMPRTAISLSGGGNRAMLCGAGFLKAADSRSTNSSISGLIDAAHILIGLSGGSWTVASVALSDYESIDFLNENNWTFDESYVFQDPKNPRKSIVNFFSLWKTVFSNYIAKSAITQVCITDIWGQLITNFVSPSDTTFKFSSLIERDWFKGADYPFPIFTSTLPLGQIADFTVAQPIIELSPFDFRSDWKHINGSYAMRYIGSDLNDDKKKLIKGFDNIGFCIGSSANVFNLMSRQVGNPILQGLLRSLINGNHENLYTAAWPNQFRNVSGDALVRNSEYIHLSDGAASGQNLPIVPLLNMDRKIDFIIAVDSSSDESGYPNGTSFHNTKEMEQMFKDEYDIRKLPIIPTEDEIVRRGIHQRNTFFGVDKEDDVDTPIILYIPNRHLTYDSAKPTLLLSYSFEERKNMIENMYLASTLNETLGKDWSKCVSCGMIERWRQRNNIAQLDYCAKCFDRYSWRRCKSHLIEYDNENKKSDFDCDELFTNETFMPI